MNGYLIVSPCFLTSSLLVFPSWTCSVCLYTICFVTPYFGSFGDLNENDLHRPQ